MKFTFTSTFLRRHSDHKRGWPGYLFGGHVRTSTLVLIAAFLAVWWVYNTYGPQQPAGGGTPPTQVVPPGFVPDPNYTWVPRTRLRQPPSTTKVTPTTTPETTTSSPPSGPPPFELPPPFGPGTSSPPTSQPSQTSPSQQPQPGPGPTPSSTPPAS